ncbi:hypothetical protein Syun_007251 [Stephania yunnanensis]|uniref:Uncharacterized protein n=1 Tax=Stephania yunnanensis TaxID=152371 RepID=A0AAP0KZ71_9MAGN
MGENQERYGRIDKMKNTLGGSGEGDSFSLKGLWRCRGGDRQRARQREKLEERAERRIQMVGTGERETSESGGGRPRDTEMVATADCYERRGETVETRDGADGETA